MAKREGRTLIGLLAPKTAASKVTTKWCEGCSAYSKLAVAIKIKANVFDLSISSNVIREIHLGLPHSLIRYYAGLMLDLTVIFMLLMQMLRTTRSIQDSSFRVPGETCLQVSVGDLQYVELVSLLGPMW